VKIAGRESSVVTAYHLGPNGREAAYLAALSGKWRPGPRSGSRLIRIGWNIASLFSRRVREVRDRALFNDFEGAAAFARENHDAINAKMREMLNYPH
jgi:hypothetical protein